MTKLEQCADKYCILACWRCLKISFTQFHDLILLLAKSMWQCVLWVFIYSWSSSCGINTGLSQPITCVSIIHQWYFTMICSRLYIFWFCYVYNLTALHTGLLPNKGFFLLLEGYMSHCLVTNFSALTAAWMGGGLQILLLQSRKAKYNDFISDLA
jgi:hypothetical protein